MQPPECTTSEAVALREWFASELEALQVEAAAIRFDQARDREQLRAYRGQLAEQLCELREQQRLLRSWLDTGCNTEITWQ
jgi:hypothetical protein